MAIMMVPGYGYVTAALLVNGVLNLWMAMQVGSARRKYKVPYPTMYANETDNRGAKVFNCVQRAHQNTLEFLPTFISLLLVGGLQYPIIAGALGFVYSVARYLYFIGYSTGDANKRFAYGGSVHFLALVGLFVCSFAFTLHQFFPDVVLSLQAGNRPAVR